MKEKIIRLFPIIIFVLILLDGGGLYERTAYFLLPVSLLYIWMKAKKKGYLLMENQKCIVSKSIMLLSGAFSVFVGIDRGESIYGFFRLVVILILGFAMRQIKEENKWFYIKIIPVLGILQSACSLLHNIPCFNSWISSTGRLAGSFEYPNTMALFLLFGVIVAEHFFNHGKRLVQVFLIIALFATGSRTAFLMSGGYLVYYFIRYRGKNRTLLFCFLSMISLIWIAEKMGMNLLGLDRFTKVSLHASTFQGRLLYWEDALKMVCKHPLGLGYMGYFYLQQIEQTGIYSVRFVHNEWLQWILDYGVLMGLGMSLYFLSLPKIIGVVEKELLCMAAVYSFFDFHMQFLSIVMIVLLCTKGEIVSHCKWKRRWDCCLLIATVCSVYLCVSAGMAHYYADLGNYGQAVQWNPFSARYKQEFLLQSENLEIADVYAEQLLKENKYLYVAYMIRSNAAAKERRIKDFIRYRKEALRLRKYEMQEYEDYFEILACWYMDAYKNNDYSAMEQCIEAMTEIPKQIDEVKKDTSVRAYRIQEKPDFYFKEEYIALLEMLQGEKMYE